MCSSCWAEGVPPPAGWTSPGSRAWRRRSTSSSRATSCSRSSRTHWNAGWGGRDVAARREPEVALAWVVGALGLAGGIAAARMIPAPTWFVVLDLVVAYLPMAWLGGLLAAGGGRAEPRGSGRPAASM